ncbi:transcription termination factor MTERF6, chloroplastic/mitochondrial-like [Phaseolus vulgaris]|uniref:transcription termination factor MTERF6, chloroplastic/mitochondrial-like n=1 Tax=Phaseolus vulgaris TaxID=3885 RepID=UPI0035CB4E91
MVPNCLIRTLSPSFTNQKTTQILLGSLLQHKPNAFLLYFKYFTSSTTFDSESDGNHHKDDTFTVSYLINSCGVSPKLARELSNRVNLKNSDGPNAVIDLLSSYGFSKSQIAKLVENNPKLICANAENTLLPKLKFFRSIGVSDTDLPKILIRGRHILCRSLEKCLIPRYEILRSALLDDEEVLRSLKSSPFGFSFSDTKKNLVPNIEVLRKCDVPQSSISYLMTHAGTLAYREHSKFVEVVNTAKEIGFNPLRVNFIVAIEVLSKRKAVWESRFEIYERWGWDGEMALRVIRKFPAVIKLSEETFTKNMSFLVKEMGCPSEAIAEYPVVVGYNLEKRIIPRFSVNKILKSKGLLENNFPFSSFICINENTFLKKFVVNFQTDLPIVRDVYSSLIKQQSVI